MYRLFSIFLLTLIIAACGRPLGDSQAALNSNTDKNVANGSVTGTFLGQQWTIQDGDADTIKGSPIPFEVPMLSISLWDATDGVPCKVVATHRNRDLLFFMEARTGEQILEGKTPPEGPGDFFFEYWEPILKLKLHSALFAKAEIIELTDDFVSGILQADGGPGFKVSGKFRAQRCKESRDSRKPSRG